MINLTGIKDIEFEATCSGDGECFCWEVDKETYIKIKGWDDELSPYDMITENLFRIYPNDIFGFSYEECKKKIKIIWKDI